MNILEINNLVVTIGKFTLKIPNFEIEKGGLCRISGANGSGKTVFLNTILGFMNYQGNMKIFAKNVNGFINNDFLVPYLYPKEYFHFIGKINNEQNYYEKSKILSEKLNFFMEEKKYIRNLSEGNKKKVGIISVMALENGITLLDEPFANLDDESCAAFSEILNQKNPEQTVILTSHQDTSNVNYSKIFDLSNL